MRFLAIILPLFIVLNNVYSQIQSITVSIPDPTIRIGETDGRTNLKVGVRTDVLNYIKEGVYCKIKKFNLTIITNNNDSICYENDGGSFAKLHKELSPFLKENDKLIFSNFFVFVDKENEPRLLDTTITLTYTTENFSPRF